MARLVVADLTGRDLDDLVARANGWTKVGLVWGDDIAPNGGLAGPDAIRADAGYSPSTVDREGGPIIDGEKIGTDYIQPDSHFEGEPGFWAASIDSTESGEFRIYGPTRLVAAMRAYVVSKLGAEVEA